MMHKLLAFLEALLAGSIAVGWEKKVTRISGV